MIRGKKMKDTKYLRPISLGLLLLTAIIGVVGCEGGGHFNVLGYSTKPPFDCDVRSVYVTMAQNSTYRRDVEFDLTRMVVQELGGRAGAPRVVSRREIADSELSLRIVASRKNTVSINELGENRQAEIGLNIEVVWKDLRPGKGGDILTNPKRFDPNLLPLPGEAPLKAPAPIPLLITPTATYAPELGGSNATAEREAVVKAARQIVNMMEIWR